MSSTLSHLQIPQVFNIVTGNLDDADRYLKQGERRLNRTKRLLTDLREQKKKYLVCPFCHGPLYIRAGSKQPHFVHFSNAEEFKSCPYKKGIKHLTPNKIKAIQYNGIQESKRHKYLKNTIGEIIATT
ncbi:DUF7830 domain-containing protein, partial [Mailhella sp.]|uniref:DUF7830 domain-containing protein n=1 Tax=Mailhella sp. TaxID=1981029 RepID=UPI004063D6A6